MAAQPQHPPSTPNLPSTGPGAFDTPQHRRVLPSSAAADSPRLLTPPTHRTMPVTPSSSSNTNTPHAHSTPHHNPALSNRHLTLDALLSTHPSQSSALEHLLADRNALAAQNAQLWKLIERQRVMQKQMERDCERLRGERDRALGRGRGGREGEGGGEGRERQMSGEERMREVLLPEPSPTSPTGTPPLSIAHPHPPAPETPTAPTPASPSPLAPPPPSITLTPTTLSFGPAPSSIYGAPSAPPRAPSPRPLEIPSPRLAEIPPRIDSASTPSAPSPRQVEPPTRSASSPLLTSPPPQQQQQQATITIVPPTPAAPLSPTSPRRTSPAPPLPLPLSLPPSSSSSQKRAPSPGPAQRRAPSPSRPPPQAPQPPSQQPPVHGQQQKQQQQPQQQPYLNMQDLTHTSVHISHTSIRPNERGKDVLSFHISVSPPPFSIPSMSLSNASPSPSSGSGPGSGSGEERERAPWSIEKLYSDILSLDNKVRAGLSRQQSRKMGAVPEGGLKAFRDQGPVKADQRKAALTAYLQSLLMYPLPNPARQALVAFFTTDLTRSGPRGAGVAREGYKEGYLTKRGKAFGGWKTRYFVLGGRVLEYYESRGGAHLGSIYLTGAKIGRQQQQRSSPSSSSQPPSAQTSSTPSLTGASASGSDMEDENAYRHAFLIIEAKSAAAVGGPAGGAVQPGQGGQRHVLCAESDEERDSWVEHLVRYVTPLPSSSENDLSTPTTSSTPTFDDARSSIESTTTTAPASQSSSRARSRTMSKDDVSRPPILLQPGAVPISQLVPDAENAKLFRAAPPPPSPGPGGGLAVSTSMDGKRASSALGTYPSPVEGPGPRVSVDQAQPRAVHSLGTAAAARLGNGLAKSGGGQSQSVREGLYKAGQGASSVSLAVPDGGPGGGDKERDRKSKSGRFWGFGRSSSSTPAGGSNAFGTTSSTGSASSSAAPPATAPHPVFGVSLQESLEVAQIANLPAVVFRCVEYLEARGAEREEGIYRLSGSSAVVKALRERFNTEGDVDLVGEDEYWDLHAVAGLLKGFLRELPTSVLTRELHLRFLSVIDLLDPSERVSELASLISALPLPNYSLLRALTAHLILIVQHSAENKMNMRNVGIVFSPTLGIPAGVFSLMLAEFNHVFNVDAGVAAEDGDGEGEGEGEEVIEVEEVRREEGEEAESSPPLEVRVKRASNEAGSRNSRSYADGAADRLLGLAGRSLKRREAEMEDASDSDNVIHEESGTETEDLDGDGYGDGDGDGAEDEDERSNSASASNTDGRSTPGESPTSPFDPHATPTQAVPVPVPMTPSRAKMTATARGLALVPSTPQGKMGNGGLPVSPRPGGAGMQGMQGMPMPMTPTR